MSYSVVEANCLLDSINTEAELIVLIEQLALIAEGNASVLYSDNVKGQTSVT